MLFASSSKALRKLEEPLAFRIFILVRICSKSSPSKRLGPKEAPLSPAFSTCGPNFLFLILACSSCQRDASPHRSWASTASGSSTSCTSRSLPHAQAPPQPGLAGPPRHGFKITQIPWLQTGRAASPMKICRLLAASRQIRAFNCKSLASSRTSRALPIILPSSFW